MSSSASSSWGCLGPALSVVYPRSSRRLIYFRLFPQGFAGRGSKRTMKKTSSMLAAAIGLLGVAPFRRVAAQSTSSTADVVEDFDCDTYLATAPVKATAFEDVEQPYLKLDTDEIQTWNLGESITAGFNCSEQLVVEVVGGQELTIISTAESAVISNARFEVQDSTKLVLDIPDLTITGVTDAPVYGAVFVAEGSSMDVMHQISFVGNTLAPEFTGYDWPPDQPPLSGAALLSAGDVRFYGKAYFLQNGQKPSKGNGFDPQNEPGGAVHNSGTMEFMKKATFNDNFNPLGGNGGAIGNTGTLTFNLRAIFRRNTVEETILENEQVVGGRGGALFNGGEGTENSTMLFKRQAIFTDNVGALGGCALASRGDEGANKITFEDKASFRDNYCDGEHPAIVEYLDENNIDRNDENKGGGALLAFGPTTVEFQSTAVFKRNLSPSGGAILTGTDATVSFVSDDELITEDNVASATCPDILVNEGSVVQIDGETSSGEDLCQRS